MNEPLKKIWHDKDIQNLIGNVLRGGVVLAASVVTCGGVLYILKYGASPSGHRVFYGEPADLRNIRGIFSDAALVHSRGIIQLGLLILIGTPVLRVALSILAFFKERDYMYMIVSAIVLAFLFYGLSGGIRI